MSTADWPRNRPSGWMKRGYSSKPGRIGAASTLGRIPFFATAGLLQALLPSVSKAYGEGEAPAVRALVQAPFRYQMMMAATGAAFISATSGTLLRLVYSPSYASAAQALSVLAPGLAMLALFQFFTTMITATGRPGVSGLLAIGQLLLAVGLHCKLIPRFGLIGAAVSTTGSITLGTLVAAWVVLRWFGPPVRLRQLLLIVAGPAAAYLVLCGMHPNGWLLPVDYIAAGVAVVLFWTMTGVLAADEWRALRRDLSIRRS